MHEVALAQGVEEIVEAQARAQSFRRVTVIRLEIGVLAHVDPEALAFAFESVSRGTVAQGSRLVIDRPAGVGRCLACGREVLVDRRGDACRACGAPEVAPTGGSELRVVDLEVA